MNTRVRSTKAVTGRGARRTSLTCALVVLGSGASLRAVGPDTLVADIRGGQEVPVNASVARGCGRFVIDTVNNTLTYRITYAGPLMGAETAAHIHGPAGVGVNAGILHALPPGNLKMGVWNYPEAQEANILAGRMYVNIHSMGLPGGEIRGQIVHFIAPLDSFQETPAFVGTGSGWGTFLIDTVANTLSYHIVIESLPGGLATETAAHIHGSAVHGTAAGVLHALPAGSPKIGVWNYPEAIEDAILAGRMYANVHTAAHPGGEIRGQIVNTIAPMDGAQEVPAVPTAAAGCVLCSLDTANDRLGFYVRYQGLTAVETAAHVHGFAPMGMAAGVIFPLPAANPKVGSWNYPAASEANILAGLTYVNIHTTFAPGGEIRGQILPFRKAVLQGDCDVDEDVDLVDFDTHIDCFSGPGVGIFNPACVCTDFDGDNDVDFADFQRMQRQFTGPNTGP